MAKLIGTGNNQVPTNGMLGGLAFQDPSNVAVSDITIETISGSPSINGFDKTLYDTAVDIFIYDTSKDSDGGAWRKRTTHTSWYNETLNTATRGARREFPAVAVIVIETLKVTIYDGDDPDLPMWMVIYAQQTNGSTTGFSNYIDTYNYSQFWVSALTSLSAVNGVLFVANSNYVSNIFYFISDKIDLCTGSFGSFPAGFATYSLPISGRNSPGKFTRYSSIGPVSGSHNDVAMTVLPNAPLDPATGLPIPTIAVATNGGVSVIKDDGTVVDITEVSSAWNLNLVEFIENKLVLNHYLAGTNSEDYLIICDIPTSDVNYLGGGVLYNHASTPKIVYSRTHDNTKLAVLKDNTVALGVVDSINHLTLLSHETTQSQSMVNFITSSYNTGWMHGDIKLATLSDTDTTNLSVTDLGLITNGDFSNGITGWSSDQIFTVSGGVASIQRNAGPTGQCYQTITTEIGRTYTVGVLVSAVSNGFQVYKDAGFGEMSQGAVNATGTHYWSFTATSTSTRLDFGAVQSGTATASFDNITIFDGVADRSVNNTPVNVTGTITRTAVATGADLVAYSGFSASNYLEQPYNSDLAPGTGVYSVVAWFKTGPTAADQYIFDRSSDGSPRALMLIRASNGGNPNTIQFYHQNAAGTNTDLTTTDITVTDDVWHHVVGLFDGSVYRVYIDGRASTITGSPVRDVDNTDYPVLKLGIRYSNTAPLTGSLALFRWSSTAPSAAQVKKMYEDEKFLFQENAACTLYGSSDAVTALAYDEVTERLHVGTSSGRSEFQGLRRINNTATAVTTAISAYDSFVVEQ